MERALTLAAEITDASLPNITLETWDIWDFPAHPSIKRRIFISWDPLPPSFLKVNFDSSLTDGRGGAGFIIRGLDFRLIATGDVRLVETSVPTAKLRMAWKGICFARLTLRADWLTVEDDLLRFVAWLQECFDYGVVTHSRVCDIHYLF